jgi:hypothetical protein
MRSAATRRPHRRAVLGLSVALTACAGPAATLTPAGSRVVLQKADAPPSCREIGAVEGKAPGHGPSEAKVDMRNKAARMGANYVRYEAIGQYGISVLGTAYGCPDSSLAAFSR